MRANLFISLFFFLSLVGFGQETTSRIDSILVGIEKSEGEEKLEKWRSWFGKATKQDLPILFTMLDKAYEDAIGIIGQDSAIVWKINRQYTIVNQFQDFGSSEKGIELLDKIKTNIDSLSLIDKSHQDLLGLFYYHMGYFFYRHVEMETAEGYWQKAIVSFQAQNDLSNIFQTYYVLSAMKTYIGDYELALQYNNQAEELLNQADISFFSKSQFYYSKSYLMRQKGELELADQYLSGLLDSLQIFPTQVSFRIQIDYASNLCDLGKVEEGIQYLEKHRPLFEKDGNNGTMEVFSSAYVDALILSGRNKEAKVWAGKRREYYDKLHESRRNEEFQEWQAKYEASEKEAKIQLLEQQKQNTQSRFIILALIALFCIGILCFLIYLNRNQKKQLTLQLERDREIAANRDRLFSSISHDIRTPLALMMAPLERVEKKISDDSMMSDIQLARRNGKRLMELFNQILDWNKAEAKALRLNSQMGQLDFTFEELGKRFQQQAKEKGIKFSIDIKIPSGQYILDYDKLDKITSNLVGNAIKFCDPNTEVQLTTEVNWEEEKSTLFLIIKDGGPGMNLQDQDQVFQRFVQGEQGKLKGGTGIGLALVKELVEVMNGKIQLYSEQGKGTIFKVSLPIKLVEEQVVETIPKKENTFLVDQKESKSQKPSLLIIEDEPELLYFLKTALSDDYEVFVANSTTAGLNVAINQIPEIIISDWTLPDHNGGWFCQQIAENELTAHIPILILTAKNSDRNQKEALDAGAIVWMNKPFDLEVLKIQLDTILQQQRRVQKNWTSKIAPEKELTKSLQEEVDPFMQKVLNIIEANFRDEQFSVEKLAEHLFLSRTQLFRKVKNITGRGPSKLINEFRLKKGRQLIKQSPASIAEVAFQVGFSDPNYFGKVYKEYFKITPSQDMTHDD